MAWNQIASSLRWSCVATFILLILFNIGYSLNTNMSSVELPILSQELPEGWRLPSIVNFVSNLSYVGILMVILIRHVTKSTAYEIPANLFVLTIGVLGLFGLAFMWNVTTTINGTRHSIIFLILTFTVAICDCVSSVTFLPYFSHYPTIFMRSFFIGDAVSYLFPSWVALAQGAGRIECVPIISENGTRWTERHLPARFSPNVFYFIMGLALLSGLISFIILCWTRIEQISGSQSQQIRDGQETITESNSELELLNKNGKMTESRTNDLLFENAFYLLCIFCNSFILSGVIPSLQTYALQPYSLEFYQKIVIAAQYCYPLMQVVSAVFPQVTVLDYPRLPYILTFMNILFCSYIFLCAKLSPCSPFVTHGWVGGLLVGLAWLLLYCFGTFSNLITQIHFRQIGGHRALYRAGLAFQTGIFIGSVISYVLTVHLQIFHERHACETYVC